MNKYFLITLRVLKQLEVFTRLEIDVQVDTILQRIFHITSLFLIEYNSNIVGVLLFSCSLICWKKEQTYFLFYMYDSNVFHSCIWASFGHLFYLLSTITWYNFRLIEGIVISMVKQLRYVGYLGHALRNYWVYQNPYRNYNDCVFADECLRNVEGNSRENI